MASPTLVFMPGPFAQNVGSSVWVEKGGTGPGPTAWRGACTGGVAFFSLSSLGEGWFFEI